MAVVYLPNNIVLDIDYQFLSNSQVISLIDETGAYSSANTGGYNAPNPSIYQALTAVANIQVPAAGGWLPDFQPIFTINIFPTLPTIGTVPFAVLPTDIGLPNNGTFQDGIYAVEVVMTFGQEATWTRSGTTITATQTAHGYSTGQVITIAIDNDITAIPLQSYTITVTNANTYHFTGVNTGATSGTFVTSSPTQYQVTSTFRMLNISGICCCKDKMAAKQGGCGCGKYDQYTINKLSVLIDAINTNFVDGLWEKCACLLQEAFDMCNCGCGGGCN